jgi:hypothetical protein
MSQRKTYCGSATPGSVFSVFFSLRKMRRRSVRRLFSSHDEREEEEFSFLLNEC